jgi:hypothetical protein
MNKIPFSSGSLKPGSVQKEQNDFHNKGAKATKRENRNQTDGNFAQEDAEIAEMNSYFRNFAALVALC